MRKHFEVVINYLNLQLLLFTLIFGLTYCITTYILLLTVYYLHTTTHCHMYHISLPVIGQNS